MPNACAEPAATSASAITAYRTVLTAHPPGGLVMRRLYRQRRRRSSRKLAPRARSRLTNPRACERAGLDPYRTVAAHRHAYALDARQTPREADCQNFAM